jgi:hypothetical protein
VATGMIWSWNAVIWEEDEMGDEIKDEMSTRRHHVRVGVCEYLSFPGYMTIATCWALEVF